MKPKSLNKKLMLNKTTVANITNSEMKKVHGGDTASRLKTVCLTNCDYCLTPLCSYTCDCTAVWATCTTDLWWC